MDIHLLNQLNTMGKYNHLDKHHDKGQGVKKRNEDGSINNEWLSIHEPWELNNYSSNSSWSDCGSITQDADDYMDWHH